MRNTVVFQPATISLTAGSGAFGSWVSAGTPAAPVDFVYATFIVAATGNFFVQVGYGATPNIVHEGFFIANTGSPPMAIPVFCPAGQEIQFRAGGGAAVTIDVSVVGFSYGVGGGVRGSQILLSPGLSPTAFFIGTAVGGTSVLMGSQVVPIRKFWLNFQPQQVPTQFDIAYGASTSAMTNVLTNILVSSTAGYPPQLNEYDMEVPPGNNIYITNVLQNEAYGSLNALI